MARGWSQSELALAAGTSQKRIWAIEAGSEPNAGTLARLARVLGLELRLGPYVLDDVAGMRLVS